MCDCRWPQKKIVNKKQTNKQTNKQTKQSKTTTTTNKITPKPTRENGSAVFGIGLVGSESE